MKKYLALLVLLLAFHAASMAQTTEIWMEPDTVYYQNNQCFYLNTYFGSGLIGAKVFHFELTFDPLVVVSPADSVSLGSMFAGIEDDTVTFVRLLNRSEIYRYFP